MNVYKSKAFAEKIGVSTSTLRRWDRCGILKAYRTPTNVKFYTDEHYEQYCMTCGIIQNTDNADMTEEGEYNGSDA